MMAKEAEMTCMGELKLYPVGVVSSPWKEVSLRADDKGLKATEQMAKIRENHRKIGESVSELHIHEQWQELLDGIEEFSHALVLYWPHLLEPERRG